MLVRPRAQSPSTADGLSHLCFRGSTNFGQQPSLGENVHKGRNGHGTENSSVEEDLLASAAATFISVAFSRSLSLERSLHQLSLPSSFSVDAADATTKTAKAVESAQNLQDRGVGIPAATNSTAQGEYACANTNDSINSVAERAAHSIGSVLQQQQQQRQEVAMTTADELSIRRIASEDAPLLFVRSCALKAETTEPAMESCGETAAGAYSGSLDDEFNKLSVTGSRGERLEVDAVPKNAADFMRIQSKNGTILAGEKTKKIDLSLCARKRQLPYPSADKAVIVEDVHTRLGEAGMRDLLAASDALSMRVFDQRCLESLSKKKWLLQVLTDCMPGSRPTVVDTFTDEYHTQEQQQQQQWQDLRTKCRSAFEEKYASRFRPQCRDGGKREPQQRQGVDCGGITDEIEGGELREQKSSMTVAGHKVKGEHVEESLCDARCLGFIVYRIDVELHAVQIGKLAVLESCRGRGYGKKLVRKIVQVARQNRSIAFVSLSALRSAATFYTRLGFKGHEDMVIDEELNAPQVYMEMQLRRRPCPPGKKALAASGTRRRNGKERGTRR